MHYRDEIPVGTKCRVREWDDLVSEYGLDEESGDIQQCDAVFTDGMRHLCGRIFTIETCRKSWDGDYYLYDSKEGIEGRYYVSGDMLEPIESSDEVMELPSNFSALFADQ